MCSARPTRRTPACWSSRRPPFQARAIIDLARAVNPGIDTVARAHSEDERAYLESHGAGLALIGEYELALAMGHQALLRMGCDDDQADAAIMALRQQPRPAAP